MPLNERTGDLHLNTCTVYNCHFLIVSLKLVELLPSSAIMAIESPKKSAVWRSKIQSGAPFWKNCSWNKIHLIGALRLIQTSCLPQDKVRPTPFGKAGIEDQVLNLFSSCGKDDLHLTFLNLDQKQFSTFAGAKRN